MATDDCVCCHFCKRLSQRAIEEVQEQNVPKHKAKALFTHLMPHSLETLTQILYGNRQKELFKEYYFG